MNEQPKIIAGLDIGHSKIAIVVGKAGDEGFSFIGSAASPSQGLRRGAIINLESMTDAIRKAVQGAEAACGVKIDSVWTAISGSEIRSILSHGIVPVSGREVGPADVEKAIDTAMNVAVPLDREVIHVIPQDYIVDDQEEIENPIGMSGIRVEAMIRIVTGSVMQAHHLIKCVNKAGLSVIDMVVDPLASAEAILTAEEKRSGIVLIDIGAELTKVATFSKGFLAGLACLNLGSDHISNDIAVGLRISPQQGEAVKKKDGCALQSLIGQEETIDLPDFMGKGPRNFARKDLVDIIHKRALEILLRARDEVTKSGVEPQDITSVVLTGGGSRLKGLPELASGIFERSVRLGVPMVARDLTDRIQDPSYATAIGLVFRAARERRQQVSTGERSA